MRIDSHEISCLICYFWKSSRIWNCRLLQIIGGAFWAMIFCPQTITVPHRHRHSLNIQSTPYDVRIWHWVNIVTYKHRLLITFANDLAPDQAQLNVRPDQDPSCLTHWWYSWKNYSKKMILKKKSADDKMAWNLPAGKALTYWKSPFSWLELHIISNMKTKEPMQHKTNKMVSVLSKDSVWSECICCMCKKPWVISSLLRAE